MAKITLVLDTRRANVHGRYPILLRLSHNSKSTSIGTGVAVLAEHWCGEVDRAVTSQCPNARQLNADLETLYFKYSNALRRLEQTEDIRTLPVTELKNRIIGGDKPHETERLTDYFARYADSRRKENSRIASRLTLNTILAYCGPMYFTQATVPWLKAFESHLIERGNSTNTRAFHFRNIRAVFNSAINDEVIGQELYPFRKFKIKSGKKAQTVLTKEQLQTLLHYPFRTKTQQMARDLFALSFYTCGLNMIDLYQLTELKNGRAVFVRTKIATRNDDAISLLIQPEARAIIDRYRGRTHVLSFAEEYPTYETFANRMQKAIRRIGTQLDIEHLKFYAARYTWATLADKLGINEKEISKGLGHVDTSVAGKYYIAYDWTKVDRANRQVIDYVLGKTKTPAE